MKQQEQVRKIQDAIDTLNMFKESKTDSFRIVINALKEKRDLILKKNDDNPDR